MLGVIVFAIFIGGYAFNYTFLKKVSQDKPFAKDLKARRRVKWSSLDDSEKWMYLMYIVFHLIILLLITSLTFNYFLLQKV